jgi:hypothetical protein
MHSYLKSIGFSKLKKAKEIDDLLQQVVNQPTETTSAPIDEETDYVEYKKKFGSMIGIAVRGELFEGNFHMDSYYPYFYGNCCTSLEPVEVEKHVDHYAYSGMCDDVKVGVSLIFHLENTAEYLSRSYTGKYSNTNTSITLSALADSGKILLPISKTDKEILNDRKVTNERNQLIAAAREGDEEAIESLTLEDMDTYSMISQRILHEDILTIVDSSFMPYGIESDHYSILGEILDVEYVENLLTKERMVQMTLNCNELLFDVCINEQDLLGEPQVGRRFKGAVWMQGVIHYDM